VLRAQHQFKEWPSVRRRGVGDRLSHAAACPGNMQTVHEAAGGADGLLRLANAWHARVMPDEVVSHGFHPEHSQRLAAYWAESLGGQRRIQTATATRPLLCGCIAATVRTRRWTVEVSPASIEHWSTSALPSTTGSDRCYTNDYFALTTVTTMSHTTGPQRTSRTGFTSRGGRGTDLSTGDGTSHNPPLPPLVVSATRLIS
jgi:hypothetical protein